VDVQMVPEKIRD